MLKLLRKIPKKILILIVVLAVISGLVIVKKQTGHKPATLVSVKREDLRQEISASGVLTGKDSANLKFETGGKLSYVNIKVGDKVSQGEVLAGLDTQDLSINLQEAQNTLRDKQATLAKIYDDIKGHDTNETFEMRQERTTAEVAVNNAEEAVTAAQRAFQDDVITSPIDGLVTEQDPLPGQVVSVTDTIAQVVNFSTIIFSSDVDEGDISHVSLGQRAEVTLNAYGDKVFTGIVTEIAPSTHTTSNGQTVVTVKVQLDDQTIKPISGLNGQVNVIEAEKKNALAIPQDALRGDNTVIVEDNNQFKVVKVSPGFKSDSDVEILGGLKEGDQVASNPQEVKI